jgi:Putative beta-barrel porin 2
MRTGNLSFSPSQIGAVVFSLLLSAPLFAQAAAARGSWLWVTTGEQDWDNNVRYVADSLATKDVIRRINTSLQITKVKSRGTFTFQGTGAALFYEEVKALNTLSYNFAGSGTYKLGALTNAIASANYGSQLVGEVTGAVANPLLSRAVQHTLATAAGIDRRLTPFATMTVGASYTRVTFDTPGLIPGTNITGSAAIRRRFRTRGAIGLLADISQGDALGIALQTQSLAASWQPLFRSLHSLRAELRGGVTRSVSGPFPAVFSPTGSATVSDTVGKGLLSLAVNRSVSQGFGLGSLLVTTAEAASYIFQARRGNLVTLSASNSYSKATAGPNGTVIPLRARGVGGNVRRVFSKGITLGGGASYRFRDDIVRATGYMVQLQAGFTLRSR